MRSVYVTIVFKRMKQVLKLFALYYSPGIYPDYQESTFTFAVMLFTTSD